MNLSFNLLRTPAWAALVLASGLLLSACGFQLRGAMDIPDSLKTLYFSSNSNHEVARSTRRLLRANGVELTDTAALAPYHLQILSLSTERRATTINRSAKVEEYELRTTLRFQILDKTDTPAVAPTSLYVERVYTFDEDNINAKGAEEALIRREMYDELSRQLVRRYLGLASSQANPR